MALALDGGDGPTDASPSPATAHKLTLVLPVAVVRQLRARMAAEETTIRALVLEALQVAGYAVAVDEIRDRRRVQLPIGAVDRAEGAPGGPSHTRDAAA